MNDFKIVFLLIIIMTISCTHKNENSKTFTGAKGEVRLMTIDPGHFHAGLVQKEMYEQVNPIVHVFAPEGLDVVEHLNRI